MHQYQDKRKIFLFLFLILLFLTSINNQLFVKKKDSFYNLKSVEVYGLNEKLNLEVEENLSFLKNENIFFIDKIIIGDQLNKYNFIEKYNIIKFYPSKIILKLKQTNFLAKTLKNNKIYLIGSNGKFIDIEKFNKFSNLPHIYGKFTVESFLMYKNTFDLVNFNFNNVEEVFFFPSGRIDVKTKENIIIKLPIKNVKEALTVAVKIMNNQKFKNNVIDLRVSNQLITYNE